MKSSSVILLALFFTLLVAMVVTNFLLKNEYDKIDKSDIYWTYEKILQEPFKYLKIEGGNVTNIAFEPSDRPSVRVNKSWHGLQKNLVKTHVSNDTLYIKFSNTFKDKYEKDMLAWNTMVRIFSPQLLSVDGFDTNVEMFKMKQKNLSVQLSGKSRLEVESYIDHLDSLDITQKDSSSVAFEMSPDLKTPLSSLKEGIEIKAEISNERADIQAKAVSGSNKISSWETLYIKHVKANLTGRSILDIGHAQIDSITLQITDTSAIILSGGSLRKL